MTESSYRDHEQAAESPQGINFAIVTFSDTRTPETDKSGALIRELIGNEGHIVSRYHLLPDEPKTIERTLQEILADPEISVIVTNGSTGISARDNAYEVVSGLLEKRIDGFGELFRSLSFSEIGAAAMLSRAVAGTVGKQVLFSLPGSSNAVRLGMTQLILPQAAHLVYELNRHSQPEAS